MTDASYIKTQVLSAAQTADNAAARIRTGEDPAITEVGSGLNQARAGLDNLLQSILDVIADVREAKLNASNVMTGTSHGMVSEAIVMLHDVDLGQEEMAVKVRQMKQTLDEMATQLSEINEDQIKDMVKTQVAARHLRTYATTIPD
jgi:hypothetical protein